MCKLEVHNLARAGVAAAYFLVLVVATACTQAPTPSVQPQTAQQSATKPTIEASPVTRGNDQWKVVTGDSISVTVTAPGAESVKILYRPIVVEGRHIELATVRAPSDAKEGKFIAQVKAGPDFAGDVWAIAQYKNGQKKQTAPISLTAEASASFSQNPSANTDESAREDKLTGGHIETATFEPGQSNILITVNAPAFELTVWQNGKEVKTYRIGIGRKQFPLPAGQRRATQIVFNPEWVPPDSSWVEEDEDVTPGERIEPDDPRNPLGKIKIPLGEAILIHQAVRPSDLGHLVSHGCVRLLTEDLFDLAEKIIEARSLPISKEKIESLKNSKERLAVKLDAPLAVDINYDTQVIEGGVLHLYPDVYNRNTNTVENLRAELQAAGVDQSAVDDQTLREMLKRVTMNDEFVVSIADLKASRGLTAGRTEPLIPPAGKPTSARGSKRGTRTH